MNSKLQNRIWDFHGRIFVEGLRQLKTVGILFLVIFSLAALFFPLGEAISTITGAASPAEISRQLVNLLDFFPFVYLPMYTMAPIMVLMLFSFLNKRKSSDFYHALPMSRAALFISFFAAVAVWIIVVTVVSTAVSVVSCLCFPQVFQVNFSSILKPLFSSLAGSLLVCSSIALAMCITGTLFNNLLISGIILVAPRLMFSYIADRLTTDVAVFPSSYNNPFLNLSYHIPLSLLSNFTYGRMMLPDWNNIIYTAIIGLLYFLIAIFLFRHRKSEAAGYAAATPVLQTVYRLLITFLVTLFPVAIIFDCIQETSIEAEQIFLILVFYVIAAVAFCIYELITTKKIHRLLKTAPTFGIVLVLNAVLIGGVLFAEQRILAYRPTADQFTAVSLQAVDYGNSSNDYFARKSAKIRIEDEQVKKLVAETLKKSAEDNCLVSHPKESYAEFIVTLYDGGISRQRTLRFLEQEQETLMQALAKNSNYQAAYSLPELGNQVSVSHWAISTEQANTLYRILCEEAAKLTFEERYQLLADHAYPQTHYVFTSLEVSVDLDGRVCRFEVPLTADYFPKTYNRYLSFRTENTNKHRADIRTALKEFTMNENKENGEIMIEAYSASGDRLDVYANGTLQTDASFLKNLLPYLSDETPMLDDDFCKINYLRFTDKGYEEIECFFVLNGAEPGHGNGDMSGFDYLRTAENYQEAVVTYND